MHIEQRTHKKLNLKEYSNFEDKVGKNLGEVEPPKVPFDNQYILRMPIRYYGKEYPLPNELKWIKNYYYLADHFQKNVLRIEQPFVYLTVRHGIVQSQTDDLWHVDGFSMRVPHVPEQNYIYCSNYPTKVVDQGFLFPNEFDPLVFNIHKYFQKRVQHKNITTINENTLHLIDPYVIHARSSIPKDVKRTFFRISFVPIEIENSNNTINPFIGSLNHDVSDFRERLLNFDEDRIGYHD